jgi:hypothetical protein
MMISGYIKPAILASSPVWFESAKKFMVEEGGRMLEFLPEIALVIGCFQGILKILDDKKTRAIWEFIKRILKWIKKWLKRFIHWLKNSFFGFFKTTKK